MTSSHGIFAAGVGLQIMIYYLATGAGAELNYINSRGQIEALEEIQFFKDYEDKLKKIGVSYSGDINKIVSDGKINDFIQSRNICV